MTTQASSTGTVSDVAPTSSTADSDIRIVVDKQTPSEGTIKSSESSIHIVVDDKTSSSRVIRTMVNNQDCGMNLQCFVVAKYEVFSAFVHIVLLLENIQIALAILLDNTRCGHWSASQL